MYRYLKARTNSCHLVSADRTIAINPLRMSEYPDADLNYLAPLRSLVRRVNRRAKSDCAFKGVFLSNSLVSNDYAKGYSDLDIVVVLGDAAFQSVATVRRVQRKSPRGFGSFSVSTVHSIIRLPF